MANPYSSPQSESDPLTPSIPSIPTWFWIVSGIALLWNLMGLMAFGVDAMMTEEMLNQLPADQAELYKTRPSWVSIAFAVAVIAGTLGCVLLLMKKKFAVSVFGLSLLGVLAQQSHMFFLSDTFKVMGSAAMVFPIIVLLIAIGLLAFSIKASSSGWLR